MRYAYPQNHHSRPFCRVDKRSASTKITAPGYRQAEAGVSDMIESISGLSESICTINQQAVCEYTPLVEDILRSRSQDKYHIERTLDGLLDFCGNEPALHLYRRLCRYYWDIYPVVTASYVEAYRITWDSEEEEA
jgi:hypothetical protein